MSELKTIRLDLIDPHPDNPRLALDVGTVASIVAQIGAEGGLRASSPPEVRPMPGGRYQTVQGHHRLEAARKSGLEAVVCAVEEMAEPDAYMRLRTGNVQTPLRKIEEGKHLDGYEEKYGKGSPGRGNEGGLRAYARKTGDDESLLRQRRDVWRLLKCGNFSAISPDDQEGAYSALLQLRGAPEWLKQALTSVALGEGWDVKAAKAAVDKIGKLESPPAWTDKRAVSYALVTGSLKPRDVARFALIAADHKGSLDEDLAEAFEAELPKARPATLDAVRKVADPFLKAQHKRNEDEAQRDSFRTMVPLSRWGSLDDDTKRMLCHPTGAWGKIPPLIEQTGTAIEWAENSLNPITGCLHDCSYCYARDLAFSAKLAKFYRFGFAPVFHPRRLLSPVGQQPKSGWEDDVRRKNIFVGSMADVFGRWVPAEWIEAIFRMCVMAPQWNYLFLTKFPQRLAEFNLPANGWYGTTIDLQVRVRNAERAFAKIRAKTPGAVTWLSVEPMLSPLKFERLDLFDWVVIGGASSSSSAGDSVETPEWRPPFAWITDLVEQCRAAGCKVYMKDNLLGSRLLEAPAGLPVTQDAQEPPEVFDYLGRAKTADEVPEEVTEGNGSAEPQEERDADGLTAGQRAARAVLDGGTREAAAARGANWKTVSQAAQVRKADEAMFDKVVNGHISPSAALKALARGRESVPVGG